MPQDQRSPSGEGPDKGAHSEGLTNDSEGSWLEDVVSVPQLSKAQYKKQSAEHKQRPWTCDQCQAEMPMTLKGVHLAQHARAKKAEARKAAR